ncbi:sigma 54-interacting transcriptional regulator [Thermodesulfobacteriota bacterium]
MHFHSIKSKWLLAVSSLVICSGLLISMLVTQRYSHNLSETMVAQAENLAHGIALDATDKILINDLVALQKMLDHQKHSHPNVTYLFVLRNDQVLAHTFQKGFPAELLKANRAHSKEKMQIENIISSDYKHFMDIAWPIFGGKAGILRLGFSEKPYQQKVMNLWVQISLLTLGILLLSLIGTLWFVKRITRPIYELTLATQKMDKGETNVKVEIQGHDELGNLASSFNKMAARIEKYTRKLEEQTMELERAYEQTRTSCGIVQDIGSIRNLREVRSYLFDRLQEILKCGQMAFLFFNNRRDILFTLSEKGLHTIDEPDDLEKVCNILEEQKEVKFLKKMPFKEPFVTEEFRGAPRKAIVPLKRDDHLYGALMIACAEECRCNFQEINTAALILTQAAGVIVRAISQDEEIRELQKRLEYHAEFSGIVGKDLKMQLIYKMIEDIAPTDATVLILGESGTGKELVAKAIHNKSARKDKPLIVVNCSAYPSTLLESELFGHEKGAFTGATRRKPGRFELANGGTVFLDEIGEIPPSAQIKLLRILQTRRFERLGGEQTLSVDVRILAATNKDLLDEVRRGHFREDLYYRLNVIPINLPALRDKRNDIPLLARHFLHLFAKEQGKEIGDFSIEAMRLLLDYNWPGNVRELENGIEHATVLGKGKVIEVSDLPSMLHTSKSLDKEKAKSTLAEHERELLQKVLGECSWNKKEAALRLGISRNTLYVKLKKYEIERLTTH